MKMTSFSRFPLSSPLAVCMSQRKICLAETCAWIIRTATQLAAHCLALSTLATHSHTEKERERQLDIFNLLGAMPRIYQQMKAIVTRASWRAMSSA